MSRWIFLVLAIVVGAGGVAAAYLAWRGEDPPALVAANPIHDCGEVGQGAKLDREFELWNRTGQALRITAVVKGCSCAEAAFDRKELLPGARTVIRVTWEVRASRGKSTETLAVFATLADGSTIVTDLAMKALVKPDIEYSPAALEFARGNEKHTVRFSPGRLADFTLKDVYCDHKAFTAALVPGTKDTVEVTFHPAHWKPDLGPSKLSVETTSQHEPICHIPLKVAPSSGPK